MESGIHVATELNSVGSQVAGSKRERSKPPFEAVREGMHRVRISHSSEGVRARVQHDHDGYKETPANIYVVSRLQIAEELE